MQEDKRTIISTPFRWKSYLASLVVFLILLCCVLFFQTEKEYYRPGPGRNLPWLGVIYGLLSIVFGVYHTLTPKWLIVRFLGIPIRFIPWSEITHAVYIHTWSDCGKRTEHGQCIVVTLLGCPRFDPLHCTRLPFRFENPLSCLFLRFPDEQKDEFLTAFQAVYPNLEFQKESNAKNEN